MPKAITVQQGQSTASIALEHGFYCGTIWQNEANAALRATRTHMNVLMPGDVLTVPDNTPASLAAVTGKRHVFRRRGVPSLFRLQLFRDDHPLAGRKFTLVTNDATHTGTTDDQGMLEVYLSPATTSGDLEVDGGGTLALRFGHLDPGSAISGVQKRLRNLGFYSGPQDGMESAALTDALLAFQRRYGLRSTGAADETTRAKLQDVHDTINCDTGGSAEAGGGDE